jgi:hypothetical protein
LQGEIEALEAWGPSRAGALVPPNTFRASGCSIRIHHGILPVVCPGLFMSFFLAWDQSRDRERRTSITNSGAPDKQQHLQSTGASSPATLFCRASSGCHKQNASNISKLMDVWAQHYRSVSTEKCTKAQTSEVSLMPLASIWAATTLDPPVWTAPDFTIEQCHVVKSCINNNYYAGSACAYASGCDEMKVNSAPTNDGRKSKMAAYQKLV